MPECLNDFSDLFCCECQTNTFRPIIYVSDAISETVNIPMLMQKDASSTPSSGTGWTEKKELHTHTLFAHKMTYVCGCKQ